MKTKTKIKSFTFFAAIILSLSSFTSNAQYMLNNFNTTCDVTINYEMWTNCGTFCNANSVVVPAGGSVQLTLCSVVGYEICINVVEIGGMPVTTANHSSLNVCHLLTPYGQSGPNPCGGTYVASQTPTNWNFN